MTKESQLPPPYCAALCRNAMSEICIEQCNIERDASGFQLKKIDLSLMPRFPIDEISGMTKEERLIIVSAYLAKVIDHLQGVRDEPDFIPTRRPNPNHPRSELLPENIQVENILFSAAQETTSPETGEEHQS